MTDDAPPSSARVERVDTRLGLAVCRAPLSPRTLVTYARDHVIVRTPSKPDFRDGNMLDLEVVPAPQDLPRWVARFEETVGAVGAARVQLRWERPQPPDAPAPTPVLDPALAEAAGALGLEHFPLSVLLLDRLVEPPAAPGELIPIAPPVAGSGDAVARHWHGATVLYRYFEGDEPDAWRNADLSFAEWIVDVQRDLAVAGRCQPWLAMRHGAPVARLHLTHDQQGLAVVEDVVVHPASRRRGIAAALAHAAVSAHLGAHPGSRVGIVAEPGSAGERVYRRLGFRPHTTVWTLRGTGDA